MNASMTDSMNIRSAAPASDGLAEDRSAGPAAGPTSSAVAVPVDGPAVAPVDGPSDVPPDGSTVPSAVPSALPFAASSTVPPTALATTMPTVPPSARRSDLARAIAALAADATLGCVACRICGDGTTVTLTGSGRGVRPLLQWLADGVRLDGFAAADRVVGKGAALLYARLGAAAVHACTMSETGRDALVAHGIAASCDVLVPTILNRAGDGMCPIERSVAGIDDPDGAEPAIRAAVAVLMAARG